MQRRLKIGVLCSRIRVEEKWIFASLEKRGIDFDRLDDRTISFDLDDARLGIHMMRYWSEASVIRADSMRCES